MRRTTPFSSSSGDPCSDGGGVIINEQCWFLGAVNTSCENVCDSTTGYDGVHSDMINFAGSEGSDANCTSVLDSFPVTGGLSVTVEESPGGCHYYPDTGVRGRGDELTEEAYLSTEIRRACPCLSSGDVTPAFMDWNDFTGGSSMKFFYDINEDINVVLFAEEYVGSPIVEYKINGEIGGEWVDLPAYVEVPIVVSNGDSLEFRVTGPELDEIAGIFVDNLISGEYVNIDEIVGYAGSGGDCPAGGEIFSYGGYCYVPLYLDGASCDDFCGELGGTCNVDGLQLLASDTNCGGFMEAVGMPPSAGSSAASDIACTLNEDETSYIYSTTPASVSCSNTITEPELSLCACDGITVDLLFGP